MGRLSSLNMVAVFLSGLAGAVGIGRRRSMMLVVSLTGVGFLSDDHGEVKG